MIVSNKFLKKNKIKWTLTNRIGKVGYSKKVWCICSCGAEQWVWLQNIKLLKSKSCRKCGATKHGAGYTKLNRVWRSMKHRCHPTKGHKNYGLRGVKVCEEWKVYFVEFQTWAFSHGYKEGLTIERINVNGNYEPKNCKWVTQKEQMNNTRRNVNIKGKNLQQWSEELNIHRGTLQSRKTREGVTASILRPIRKEISSFAGVTFDNSSQTGKPWRVRAGHKGKVYSVGRFRTEKEAANAYVKWKKGKVKKKKLIKRK